MSKVQTDFSFADMAASYDQGLAGRLCRPFYRLLLREIQLSPGQRVLDVGCGTGALLKMLASTCQIEGWGIDTEEAMIAEAKKQCSEMDIQLARAEDTGFEGQSFDVLVSCLAFHHFSDKEGFAREAARLLKRGGELYIVDPRFPGFVRSILNRFLKHRGVVGWFGTGEEIAGYFLREGFVLKRQARDGYAQVVVLERAV